MVAAGQRMAMDYQSGIIFYYNVIFKKYKMIKVAF